MSTQIAGYQIKDGAITDAKVSAGAAIATNKLADGANFIKRDGSVPFTTNQSMGGQKLTNIGTPTDSGDAVPKSYLETQLANLNTMFKAKADARAATTGNITLSNPGTASFDGVTLSNGDVLFVRAQSAPAENGLYTFNGSGAALTRISGMDAWAEVPGAFFAVTEGTTYADTLWLCTANAGGTLNTTAITFQQIPSSAGLTNSSFVDKETPSGAMNGSNVTFTLANTPVLNSEHLYLNGMLIDAGDDYTISGTTITMATAPLSTDKLRSSYRK